MIDTSAGSLPVVPRGGRPLCVYAIVRAGAAPPVPFRTRSGERLRVARHGALAAVVRDIPRTPSPTPANIRRYDRTMRELAQRFPALLPARFGTCLPEDELRFILSARRNSFTGGLRRVRGRVQMTVRVIKRAGRTAEAEAAQAESGVLTVEQAPTSGRDYLLARARNAAASRVVPGFEPVGAAVRRWVREERVERRADVATVYHLIPRASVGRYRTAVRKAAAAAGLPMIVSGPWPPYAFGTD